MQDLLKNFPCELIEEGLEYLNREISTGGRRLDLAFVDRRKRILLVEVQKDSLDTKHIDRHIDFVEGFVSRNPDVDVRLMYIANRIDHLRKSFLEKRGYEYLEISEYRFEEIARRNNFQVEFQKMEIQNLNELPRKVISSPKREDINPKYSECSRCYQKKSSNQFSKDLHRSCGLTAMCKNCIKVHHLKTPSIAQFVKDRGILLHKGKIIENIGTVENAELFARKYNIELDIVQSVKKLFKE